ncbi:MAG: hypothetical protein AAF628_22705 [Planctomycetota bacterium]
MKEPPRIHLLALAATAAVSLAPNLDAQLGVWRKISDMPDIRASHAMAYDSARGVVVVFGGSSGLGATNDTLEWNGSEWIQLEPLDRPPPLLDSAMAYDEALGQCVLFGGSDGSTTFGTDGMWAWDGANWTELHPRTRPPIRHSEALVFDSARQVLVLFGGRTAGVRLTDTWEWDGTNWTELAVAGPPFGETKTSTFDSLRARTLVVGGTVTPHDMWSWDGSVWENLGPTPGGSTMAYDARRDRVVLFYNLFFQTWQTSEFDGVEWTTLSHINPPSTRAPPLVYDEQRGVIVAAGDLVCGYRCYSAADVYEYRGPFLASFDPLGVGCAGSAGVPTLDADPGFLPITGREINFSIGPLAPGTAAAGVMGTSALSWGPIPLPASLDPIGATGCSLYTSIEVTIPLVIVGDTARWNLVIPQLAVLVGADLYHQGFVIGDPINPAGIVTSNYGRSVIGTY